MAAVLRLQPEDVAPRRDAALDRLATQLGMHDEAERARLPELLAELPGDQWPDDDGNLVSSPPPPKAAPAAPPARGRAEGRGPAEGRTAARRRRPLAAIVVIVVGALLGGFIGLLLFGGDAEDDGDSAKPAATAQAPAPEPKTFDLKPVSAGFPGRGTARIEGSGANSRLVMSLSDLPPREEAYQVWLYNSLFDAVADRPRGGQLARGGQGAPGGPEPLQVRRRVA